MDTSATGLNTATISVADSTDARTTMDTVKAALSTVSAERSKLGAYQNRLEHSIKNIDSTAENLQAAESRIKDVDMAKEMMEFTKNNILQQAAQSMLAQANQAPQGVLQLLR
jgi:flagellin